MKSLLLIDLSALYWRNWHATADKEVSAAFDATVQKVHQLAEGYDYVAVCCDSPPYKRKELLSSYKAQREAAPPLALEQFARVKERLRADAFLLWEAPGYEADDVIAWASSCAVDFSVTIASADKDLMALVDDRRPVSQLNPFDGKTYNVEAVIAKFGVSPEQIPDFLALVGDSSDNIPGAKGIGPVKAAKLLMQYDTLEGVIAAAPSIGGADGKAILESVEQLRVGRKVIELRTDVPLNFAELFAKREPVAPAHREYELETEEDADLAELMPSSSQGAKSAALALRTDPSRAVVQFEHGLEPQSLNGAYKLARGMVESKLYFKFKNAEAIWAVMIRGREMGIGALTALDCFHVIEGKPALHAHLIVARAKQHPDCEYFQLVESSATSATYVTKRRGNPTETRLTYTLAEAQQAGRAPERMRTSPVWVDGHGDRKKDARSQWEKMPAEMIRKSCAVQLARVEYPEAALGLYAVEELEE